MFSDEERYAKQNQPIAVEVRDNMLAVTLKDGRIISTPLEWYPRLMRATPDQLRNIELMPDGVHWVDLDEDLSIAGMLKGIPARNSPAQEPA